MSTNTIASASAARGLGTGTWHLDPARSSVEFHVRLFYGLMTVKGRFERYQGRLDLSGRPAVELTVDADSVNTGIEKRDEHLRTDDFFDVANHPDVRFVSDSATHQGDALTVSGRLHAAGKHTLVEVNAQLRDVGIDNELAIEATAFADPRELGMRWPPMGIARAPITLTVHGRLVRQEAQR
ncbi:MAG TPA: YceI family protein [Solirubrobacteraceae bacterium]|nr:YceI family protein [Solirubrobacteraceae bacterium]